MLLELSSYAALFAFHEEYVTFQYFCKRGYVLRVRIKLLRNVRRIQTYTAAEFSSNEWNE